MPTCGYICPSCSGTGYLDGEVCTWCAPIEKKEAAESKPKQSCQVELTDEEWMKQVHEGPCCGDWK